MASHQPIVFTALTWNLFHGRDDPPEPGLLTWRSRLLRRTELGRGYAQVNRPLRGAFAATLDRLDWQVALLQECPPRWLPALARRCRASGVTALTSRNELAPLRAALADRNPDLIASNEGGCNALLVRAPWRIAELSRHRLATRPERRRLLLARLAAPGARRLAAACMHLSVPATGRGAQEAVRAAELALDFAAGDPLLFGGDLNLRPSEHATAFESLRVRFGLAPPTPGRSIDHLLARGLDVPEPPAPLEGGARELPGPDGLRLRLSDHAPVRGSFGLR